MLITYPICSFLILVCFLLFQLIRLFLISKDEVFILFCRIFLRKRYKEIYQQKVNNIIEPGLRERYFS